MRLLVTRPLDDALDLAERLAARGHEAVLEPLLTIAPDLFAPLSLDGVRALLFTSANGVRAFALRSPRRDLPVFAVGDATAAAAREIGFAAIETAQGDVAALEELVVARLSPADGPLLHVAGRVVAGDLAGRLGARGYRLHRAALYAAEPATRLSAAARAALEGGTLDGVLLFSPRTAATFVALMDDPRLRAAAGRLTLFALSRAVADAAADLGWRRVAVAPRPDEAALLDLIDGGAAPGADASKERPAMASAPAQAVPPPPPRDQDAPARPALSWPVLVVGLVAVVGLTLDLVTLALAPGRDAARRDSEAAAELRVARLEREVAGLAALRAERDAAGQRAVRLEALLGEIAGRIDTLGTRVDQIDRDWRAELARGAAAPVPAPVAVAADPAPLAAMAEDLQRLRDDLAALRAAPPATVPAQPPPPPPPPVAAPQPDAAPSPAREAPLPEAIRRVEAAAAAAPPDLATLRADFPRRAAQALRAVPSAAGTGAWWAPLADRLAGLVAIRRVGDIPGDDVEAILARAEQRLVAGDLDAALAVLAALPPAPAEALAPWVAAARARVELDAALAALSRSATQRR